MSNGYRVDVDVNSINKLLTQLNDRDAKRAIKSGIRTSALIIRKEAQSNLLGSINTRQLKKEINLTIYKNASGARVDLLDKRKKGSKQFILKFFELGTDDGTTNRKGNYRGKRIPEYRFLKHATNSKKSEAENSLTNNIIFSINRVIRRNK